MTKTVCCIVCLTDVEVSDTVAGQVHGWDNFRRTTGSEVCPEEFMCRHCWNACMNVSLKPKSLAGHMKKSYESGVMLQHVRREWIEELYRRLQLFPEYANIVESRRVTLVLNRLEGKK